MKQYLDKLGLKQGRDHTTKEIKKAWLKKCQEHHPDAPDGNHEEFLAITHAYKMLTDPSYRHEEENREKSEKADLNVRLQVPIKFEDAFFGKKFTVTFNRNTIDKEGQAVAIEAHDEDGNTNKEKNNLDVVSITVTVPPGTSNPQEFFIHGKGLKRGDSDEVGDVFVVAIPRSHNRFKIQGDNVVTEDQIPLDVMLKGGDVEIQTLYGLKTLFIPPGTQPNQRFEIKNCGVMKFGSHITIITPRYPSKDNLKNDESWKGLDINWENHKEEDSSKENEFIERFEAIRSRMFFDASMGESSTNTSF